MISNQILQNTIEGLKTISRADLCIMDIEGKVLVSALPTVVQLMFWEENQVFLRVSSSEALPTP